MKIVLACDHAGFPLKKEVIGALKEIKASFEDLGCHSENSVDYPDFALAVARKIEDGPQSKGILFCGSGIGVCIAANKIKGVRAGTAASLEQVKASVNDEDLNILCLSADYIPNAEVVAREIMKTFLETKFSEEERHVRRINKIKQLESLK